MYLQKNDEKQLLGLLFLSVYKRASSGWIYMNFVLETFN